MGPIFEGDGWFCVIAIIVSKLLADIPWLSDRLRLPGIVMISLIFALFYGPEPKRISKKVFVGGVVALTVASLLGELVGNFIGNGQGEKYKEAAEKMLCSLSSDKYQSRDTNVAFLLHSTGHLAGQ